MRISEILDLIRRNKIAAIYVWCNCYGQDGEYFRAVKKTFCQLLQCKIITSGDETLQKTRLERMGKYYDLWIS